MIDMQASLFDELPSAWPEGFVYAEDFISPAEEAVLIDWIDRQPLAPARYKAYTARREVLSYGGHYDFDALALDAALPIPPALHTLRGRVAHWLGVPPDRLCHALVARYPPGAPLGWHRDVPEFEAVVGLSLGGVATLRFRRYPPVSPPRPMLEQRLAPRSIYRLTGEARWAWQHAVAPVPGLRYSITFRTLRPKRGTITA